VWCVREEEACDDNIDTAWNVSDLLVVSPAPVLLPPCPPPANATLVYVSVLV
jgi:hypothetical protein